MNRQQRRAARRSGGKPPFGAEAGDGADLFKAALAHHQTGAIAQAERGYRQVLERDPRHADSLHNLGIIALQRGDAAAAAELIGQAIATNDGVADYHYNVALAWRALNRNDEVAAHLQRAIALRGDHALAHLNLGNVRREQGRFAEAVACYERAVVVAPNLAAGHFNLANVLLELDRRDAAIAHYRKVLAIDPNHAESHAALGAALMAAPADIREAIAHLETALTLKPNFPGAHDKLGKAYIAAGEQALAVHAAARAVELSETEETRTFFAQCIGRVRLTSGDDRLSKLLLRALRDGWARPRDLVNVSISAVRLNRGVADLIVRVNAAWPARLPAAELIGAPAGDAVLAQDAILQALLECDLLSDVALERVLTNVRHALLARSNDATADERLLGFYCALARQCFTNQYVYAQTDAEAAAARQLRQSLDQVLAAGQPCPPLWPVIVGAYVPLHTLENAGTLLQQAWPPSVRDLVVQQVAEPAEERRIAATIPALTEIDGEVSSAVRQQYEENPYPRWVKTGPPLPQPDAFSARAAGGDILIAGCGTGLSTIELARQARDARILAVDLSLSSLSYAKRMAQNLGIDNVEFGHADIARLGSIDRSFDFIDASGVLHHMADPWAGWRVLLSLLRPGGLMQVGLYSELARKNVVAARALIAARGYRPVLDDIRRCRQDIMASDDPLLKSLTAWADFFSADECRDLLFHVQEHRMMLPQIKAFLAENGVQFGGFILDQTATQRFAARFPDPAAVADLDRWHSFETEAPDTFAGMYQLRMRKP